MGLEPFSSVEFEFEGATAADVVYGNLWCDSGQGLAEGDAGEDMASGAPGGDQNGWKGGR